MIIFLPISEPLVRRSSHSEGGAKDTLHKTPRLAIVGVYSLKFVECQALGVTFDGINDKNIQGLRMKMAAEILDEGGNTVMNSLLAN